MLLHSSPKNLSNFHSQYLLTHRSQPRTFVATRSSCDAIHLAFDDDECVRRVVFLGGDIVITGHKVLFKMISQLTVDREPPDRLHGAG